MNDYDINLSFSPHFCMVFLTQDAFFESDKLKTMKIGSEPILVSPTSINEEEKLMLGTYVNILPV